MKISIIIPVYNVEQYIERCFLSVVNQTYDNSQIECFFIDDCSPDNSKLILEELIQEYQGEIDFKIISHKNNIGLSGARNTGITNAEGKYIYFLDSDDDINSDCIFKLVEIADNYPNIDFVQGSAVWIEDDLHDYKKSAVSVLPHIPPYIGIREELQKHMLFDKDIPVTAWNRLIRKEFILKNDLFFKEGIIHEDNAWNLKAFAKVNSVCFSSYTSYNYYINTGSITTNPDKTKSIESFWDCIKSAIQIDETENSLFYRYFIISEVFSLVITFFLKKHHLDYVFIHQIKREIKEYLTIRKKAVIFSTRFIEKCIYTIFIFPKNLQKLMVYTSIIKVYHCLHIIYRRFILDEVKSNAHAK